MNRTLGQYGFIGYDGRKRAKLTWPLVLVNMALPSTFDTIVGDSVKMELKHQYVVSPHNVRPTSVCFIIWGILGNAETQLHVVDIELQANGRAVGPKRMDEGCRLIERSIKSSLPANTIVVIDTHADTLTGGLQWAGGTASVRTAPVSDILREFCGTAFFERTKAAAETARKARAPDKQEWYTAAPFHRGGWRGLVLATCGPAMRQCDGFNDLKTLVERYDSSPSPSLRPTTALMAPSGIPSISSWASEDHQRS